MRLIRCLSDFKGTKRGIALAIGNFDGLHKGHQKVLKTLKEAVDAAFEAYAKEYGYKYTYLN